MNFSLARPSSLLLLAFALQVAPITSLGAPPSHSRNARIATDKAREGTAKPVPRDSYQFIDIKITDAEVVNPSEINDFGIVSGLYNDTAGNTHTFVWVAGHVATINHTGAQHTAVSAITSAGLLFGNWGSTSEQHAGYYNLLTGKWTQLPDIAGYPANIGSRMAESGNAVGYACTDSFFELMNCVGWMWDGRKYTFIRDPEAVSTYPNGINSHGEVVGYSFDASGAGRGFTYRSGKVDDLTVKAPTGAVPVIAYDVTEGGEILGVAAVDPDATYWPSIFVKGNSFTVLPFYPNVVRTFYTGMNERGDLVGIWFNDPTPLDFHGFVAMKKGRK